MHTFNLPQTKKDIYNNTLDVLKVILTTKDYEMQKWQILNKDSIRNYNERVAKSGVFSDGMRSF